MAGPAYIWNQWRFEPTECRLMRDGAHVPLPAKTLDLLATLLKRAPRLVTKEEILTAVWPDAAVEEGNIAFHIAALRKVLDAGDGPSAIETVRGRGYRFVHEVGILQLPPTDEVQRHIVEPRPPASSPASPTRAARISRATVIAAIVSTIVIAGSLAAWYRMQTAPPAIAVQAFDIISPGPGQENFPDGLSTYLTTKLQLAGIKMASRDSAQAVLSGQLHPTANGFRVDVQLIGAGDSARLWDWSFEVSNDEERPSPGTGPDDVRSRIQGIISARVASGLQRRLTEESPRRPD